MCGIVCYALKNENAIPLTLQSLHHLEYRGYDSVGLSFFENGKIATHKTAGRVLKLEKEFFQNKHKASSLTIAHTRWSTHGNSTTENAHPHHVGKIALIHNGIIENYKEIKQELENAGCKFTSQTDTEVIAQYINLHLQNNPRQIMQQVLEKFQGKYAIAFIVEGEEKIYALRSSGSPMVVGFLKNGFIIASDINTASHHTNKFIVVEDREMLEIVAESLKFFNQNGKEITKQHFERDVIKQEISKNGFETFMMKEIHEQSGVVQQILQNLTDGTKIKLPFEIANFEQIKIIACGTSYFAGLFAKQIIEENQEIPVAVEIASEFSQRRQPFLQKTLFMFASQSGETADSISAMELVVLKKTPCSKILTILNNVQSTMGYKSDFTIPCFAGVEIGVASTKNFIAQLIVFYLIAFQNVQEGQILKELQLIPQAIASILANIKLEESIAKVAHKIVESKKVVFTGRTFLAPIASEGALKLSELSYISVQSISAGEFKHGPIAIVDNSTLLISLTHSRHLFQKTLLSNEEVSSRDGNVCLMGDKSANYPLEIVVEEAEYFQKTFPILLTIPVQLLAYCTAKILGNDIDKPRNLAKSVTVE